MDICPSLGNSMTSQTGAGTLFALILIWLLHVLIAPPYYTIQPDGQTDMALCHNFHSSVSALMEWKVQKPSRCLSKGCPWAEYFMRWTFGPQQSAEQQQHQQQGYAWYRRSRRRWSLRQKILLWPIDGQTRYSCCSPLFHPNVPNSFCALQTPLLMFVGRFLGSLSILCWLGTFCRG